MASFIRDMACISLATASPCGFSLALPFTQLCRLCSYLHTMLCFQMSSFWSPLHRSEYHNRQGDTTAQSTNTSLVGSGRSCRCPENNIERGFSVFGSSLFVFLCISFLNSNYHSPVDSNSVFQGSIGYTATKHSN